MAPANGSLSGTSQLANSENGPTLSSAPKGNRKWVVLIGVAFYMKGTTRLVQFDKLSGPTHDIKFMKEFFIRRLRVDESNILILKSTNPQISKDDSADPTTIPENEPMERDRSEWPTYENILRVLNTVIERADVGDFVYIYYSGHGARAATLFPQKGTRGVDEALAPLDINCGGRYVRDFEIAAVLHKMVKHKKLHVTAILDSCHSGGATKSYAPTGAVARGIGVVDVTQLPTDRSDIPQEDLDAAFQAGAFSLSRFREDFWLDPQGYVLMAACLPIQTAWEVEIGGVMRGVFTFWVISSLELAASKGMLDKLTHDMLHGRVLANIIDWGKNHQPDPMNQVPVLMGNSKRLFAGNIISRTIHSVPVLEVLSNEVRLRAGRANGVCEKDCFGIYRWNDEVVVPGPPIVIVRVQQVFETESMAAFLGNSQKVNIGDQAILLRRQVTAGSSLKLLRPAGFGEIQAYRFNRLRELWDSTKKDYASGVSPLHLVDDDSNISSPLHVTLDGTGTFKLLNRELKSIPNIPLLETPESVLETARQLGRYVRFRDLKNPDKLDREFSIDLIPHGAHSLADSVRIIPEGESYDILFRNLSFHTLYLTLFDFRPLWGVRQVYPANGDWEEINYPDNVRKITFKPSIPSELGSASHVIGTLKAFITTEPTSFRSLCMADINVDGLDECFSFPQFADVTSGLTQAAEEEPESQLIEALSNRDPFPPKIARRGVCLHEVVSTGPSEPEHKELLDARNQNPVMSSADITWQAYQFTICTLSKGAQSAGGLQLPADAIFV